MYSLSYRNTINYKPFQVYKYILFDKWKPSSLSELTPITFNLELIHLGSEASLFTLLINIILKKVTIKNAVKLFVSEY